MLKKLNQITNITIGSFVGVFIGCGIYVFWDYKKHPDLYAMQSAPWYTSIFVYGIVMLIFVTVAVIAKLIIRKKMKKEIESNRRISAISHNLTGQGRHPRRPGRLGNN